ncbi:hypothetical protein GA0074692_2906 [Micromonospora pallida]|uniref:Uncharacterized protein n=1 Tax=Micromonospora pallida TaxID=145854 RepID=A0A1C6SLM0_9ACTN|nr:hypothetical protein [Micromonospora pallida]SCL30333.1 hypothetical protein GA0074692_2906 [Micromonospora pallida]
MTVFSSDPSAGSLCDRFRRWWRDAARPVEPVVAVPVPVPPSPPRLPDLVLEREAPEPVLVPAQGDAFDFRIQPVYTWTAKNMPLDEFRQRVENRLGWAGHLVRDQSSDLARQHEPHRALQLERELNGHFAGRVWSRSGDAPTLGVRVRVLPDQRIRERLRPYWEERISIECAHDLATLRTRQAEELTSRWREVLCNLHDDPVTRHAARLAEKQFAQVFGEYADERRRVPMELADLLRDALKGHHDLGLGPSEYTEAWDAAIRAHQLQYGLTEPI